MSRNNEFLNSAIDAVRADGPHAGELAASAARISDRLGIAMPAESAVEQIRSCQDVRHLMDPYRQGNLSEARSLAALTLPIAGTAIDAAGERGAFSGTLTINRFVGDKPGLWRATVTVVDGSPV